LAEGKARPHCWAPEKGYVTFKVRNENDLASAMELIQMSHNYFTDDLALEITSNQKAAGKRACGFSLVSIFDEAGQSKTTT